MEIERINKGTIFPITENGEQKMYVTDAPYNVIAQCFDSTDSTEDFKNEVIEKGYRINKYSPSIYINFDEK